MQCGPVAEAAVGDPHRPDAHLDPELARSRPRDLGPAGDRVGGVRVAVRVAPRPVLAGHRQLELEPLVVGLQVLVGDRPVLPHPVARADLEVGGMKARAVAGVVDHRAADAVAGVVLAELDRVLAADDPLLGPVELVRAGLVGDPVLVGIPERARLEHHHLPAAAGQPLGQRRRRRRRRRRSPGRPRSRRRSAPSARAGRRGGGRRAGTPSRSPAGAARRAASVRSSWRAAHVPSTPRSRGVLDRVALERRRALPALALAGAEAGVAARIGRAAEADLVPRPGMRVERAEHRAHDHAPGPRRAAARPTPRRAARPRRTPRSTSLLDLAARRRRSRRLRAGGRRRRARRATRRQVSRSSGMSA